MEKDKQQIEPNVAYLPNSEVKYCQIRKKLFAKFGNNLHLCSGKEFYMDKSNYLPRVCDDELQQALAAMGAVLIEDAKWFGRAIYSYRLGCSRR